MILKTKTIGGKSYTIEGVSGLIHVCVSFFECMCVCVVVVVLMMFVVDFSRNVFSLCNKCS